jgi:hypothetical protein
MSNKEFRMAKLRRRGWRGQGSGCRGEKSTDEKIGGRGQGHFDFGFGIWDYGLG